MAADHSKSWNGFVTCPFMNGNTPRATVIVRTRASRVGRAPAVGELFQNARLEFASTVDGLGGVIHSLNANPKWLGSPLTCSKCNRGSRVATASVGGRDDIRPIPSVYSESAPQRRCTRFLEPDRPAFTGRVSRTGRLSHKAFLGDCGSAHQLGSSLNSLLGLAFPVILLCCST